MKNDKTTDMDFTVQPNKEDLYKDQSVQQSFWQIGKNEKQENYTDIGVRILVIPYVTAYDLFAPDSAWQPV